MEEFTELSKRKVKEYEKLEEMGSEAYKSVIVQEINSILDSGYYNKVEKDVLMDLVESIYEGCLMFNEVTDFVEKWVGCVVGIKAEVMDEVLLEVLEDKGYGVYRLDDCVEVETHTKGGVAVVFTLFREGGLWENFMKVLDEYNIDEEIMIRRQSEDYVRDFTLSEALEDFGMHYRELQEIVKIVLGRVNGVR